MGISSSPFLVSLVHDEEIQRKQRIVAAMRRRPTRVLMKKRLRRSRMERRVKTLKKLVPSSKKSIGLDGLFTEAAEYILSLQMRVKVMQIMVKALTGSDDE